jgi:hypothetical protein
MKQSIRKIIPPALILLSVLPGLLRAHTPVPLNNVPAVVLTAVHQRVPAMQVSEASVDVEGELILYAIAGIASGKEIVVEVTAQGTVIQIQDRQTYEEHVD